MEVILLSDVTPIEDDFDALRHYLVMVPGQTGLILRRDDRMVLECNCGTLVGNICEAANPVLLEQTEDGSFFRYTVTRKASYRLDFERVGIWITESLQVQCHPNPPLNLTQENNQ